MSKNKNREQTTKNRLVEEYKDEVVLYLLLLDDLVLSILLPRLHIIPNTRSDIYRVFNLIIMLEGNTK